MAAGVAGRDRSNLAGSNMRNGVQSPGNLTSAAANNFGQDQFQYDKTGAPVNIIMAPEEDEEDAGDKEIEIL